MKKDNVVERMFLGLLTVNIPPALLAAALRLCYSSVTRGFLDVIPSLQVASLFEAVQPSVFSVW